MGITQKINPGNVACFSKLKMTINLPAFHQQSTTDSPQKNHVLHTVFAKTSSKNAGYIARKKLLQNAAFSG
jgi:hypothetical protein